MSRMNSFSAIQTLDHTAMAFDRWFVLSQKIKAAISKKEKIINDYIIAFEFH